MFIYLLVGFVVVVFDYYCVYWCIEWVWCDGVRGMVVVLYVVDCCGW